MVGPIAWLVLKTGLPRKVIVTVLILLAIGAAVLAWSVWLSGHDEGVIEKHETGVELQVQTEGRAADQNMVARRDADEAAITEDRKEFDNATSHLPKSGLTARQRVDACDQLRRQGTAPAVLARAGCVQAGAPADARP